MLLLVVVVPVVILLAVVIWEYVIDPTFFPPLKDKVEATARYDNGVAPIVTIGGGRPFRCTKEYPVMVQFQNRSRRTVRDIGFSIEANVPGRSTNVVDPYLSTYLDAIIQPQRGWTQCYAVQLQPEVDPSAVEYKVKVNSASE